MRESLSALLAATLPQAVAVIPGSARYFPPPAPSYTQQPSAVKPTELSFAGRASGPELTQPSLTSEATRLRSDLLRGYDRLAAPITTVGVQIRFFKVEGVRAAEGSMRLKIWLRLTWSDERLRWNAAEYSNLSYAVFGEHEVWVPDIQPYNTMVGISNTLDAVAMTVSPDGSVFWSRPGMLDVMCKFSGLVAFPFDTLSCVIEMGGWSLSGNVQNITLEDGGYVFSSQEESAGTSYQEYTIKSIEVSRETYFYPCCPDEPWPILKYLVNLDRAHEYYTTLVIWPSVLLTYCSMGVFFMSCEVGERLSYGITLLLAAEVTKVVMANFLPVCGELLWIDLFTVVCSAFSVLSLIESLVVLSLAYHRKKYILPRWIVLMCRLALGYDPAGRTVLADETVLTGGVDPDVEPCAGPIYRSLTRSGAGPGSSEGPGSVWLRGAGLSGAQSTVDAQVVASRLAFYESLFFRIDAEADGYLGLEDMSRFLSFILVEWESEACTRVCKLADLNQDGLIVRREFVELCATVLADEPIPYVEQAAENFLHAQELTQRRNRAHWAGAAQQVDRLARLTLPFLYTTSLLVLFQLDLSDPYLSDPGARMIVGIGVPSMSTAGIIKSLVPTFVVLLCIVGWLGIRSYARQRKLLRKQPTRDEIRLRNGARPRQLPNRLEFRRAFDSLGVRIRSSTSTSRRAAAGLRPTAVPALSEDDDEHEVGAAESAEQCSVSVPCPL